MADYESEIPTGASLIVELLKHPDFAGLKDARLYQVVEALKELTKNNKDTVASNLRDIASQTPITFEKIWPSALVALKNFSNDPTNTIKRVALLFGWAYIESVWSAQVTGRQTLEIAGKNFATLAAIQLGLPETLDERDVITAIFTHSNLLSNFLLSRFEQGVIGGLEQINSMGTRLADWEKRLNATEERANNAEAKISAYNKTLTDYEVAFGFLGMSAAFKAFFDRKQRERKLYATALIVLFASILLLPIIGYISSYEHGQVFLEQLEKYVPFAVILFLLIYFFRVVLLHFNSTQAQLLQLESKMASLAFIQEYVAFLKENNSPDLSKFESLVFGGIVADLDKVPSTFDGLEQLAKTVTQLRSEK